MDGNQNMSDISVFWVIPSDKYVDTCNYVLLLRLISVWTKSSEVLVVEKIFNTNTINAVRCVRYLHILLLNPTERISYSRNLAFYRLKLLSEYFLFIFLMLSHDFFFLLLF